MADLTQLVISTEARSVSSPALPDSTANMTKFIQRLQQHTPAVCFGQDGTGYGIDQNQCYTGRYWQCDNKPEQKFILTSAEPTEGVCVRLIGAPVRPSKEYRKDVKSVLQNDGLFIPLNVVSFTGAQYNSQTPVCNLVFPKELFVSNYANSSFVFEHLHRKSMVVNYVKVISTVRPKHGGYPIGSGLIFLSNNLSAFSLTQRFHSF